MTVEGETSFSPIKFDEIYVNAVVGGISSYNGGYIAVLSFLVC